MVYYKLILDEKRFKKDQMYPIVIRITHNRSNTTLTTGIRIKKEEWDIESSQVKKNNSNFQTLNQNLTLTYLKVQTAILKLQETNEFSFDALRELLITKAEPFKTKYDSFNEFSKILIRELHDQRKPGNAIIYQTASNRLLKFADKRSLKFREIDYKMLEAFKNELIKDKIKVNSISNYLRTIRAIYNKAIKAKLIDRVYYPFHDISIKSEFSHL